MAGSNFSIPASPGSSTPIAVATPHADTNGNTVVLHETGYYNGTIVVPISSGNPLPISAASLPLPTGAADAATLATISATMTALLAVEKPYQGVVAMTGGTAQAAQRAVRIACTVAGNVSLTYADGSTDVVPVNVGLSYISGAITTINISGTTATATYANMK